MTKQDFIKHIKELQELKEIEEKIQKSFKLLNDDFNFFSLGRCETLIVNILKSAMDDEYDNIEYFIYELDFGKKYHKTGDIFLQDGTIIYLKNAGILYDYLMSVI